MAAKKSVISKMKAIAKGKKANKSLAARRLKSAKNKASGGSGG
jgi:hypothetical protein